jgi:NifU-like protein involved in Fe-S cluster formation
MENPVDKEAGWVYSRVVEDHFLNPRNLMMDEENYKADGVGKVGSHACGDMMVVWLKIDQETEKINDCKWRTFGCASAIASTSMMSVMATENGGMEIQTALKLKPQQIIERLNGLPDRKFHCSVLGHEALREAANDYLSRKNN